jgi:exonuclease III
VGSWNVRGGLAAGRRALAPAKALELLEILRAHNFDVVAVQETSQVQDGVVRGDAYYAWYADERPAAANRGLGFFVRECSQLRARVSVGLLDATCTHCLWLRIAGGAAAPDLYIGNVYLPTAGQPAPFSAALAALQTDTQAYASRGKVVLLGDFNAAGLGRGQGEFDRVAAWGAGGAD